MEVDDTEAEKSTAGGLKPPATGRSISCESEASHYTDALSNQDSDEDDLDDMDGYYDDSAKTSDGDAPDVSMHPQLYADMENLVLFYGETSMSYRLLESIDEIDVELNVPLAFLESATAEAWKVNRAEPLIIRLHLSLSSYLESASVPKIEVFQPSRSQKFGFGSQIRKILENYLLESWRGLSDQLAKINAEKSKLYTPKSQSFPIDLAGSSSSKTKRFFPVDDTALVSVMGMGFSAEIARNALIITKGDANEATNLLLSNPETCTDLNLDQLDTDDEASKRPPKPKRQQSHPPLLKQLKKMLHVPSFNRSQSMVPSATDPNIASSSPLEDLTLLPQSTLLGKNAKRVPRIADGFLVQLFRYVRQRVPTLNEYCVVCDEPHVFQNGAMLKPAVCSRELCVFAFQTLGVMSDAADDIATGAEVVDLLLAMTRAACKSNRKSTIFDPYPTVVDPRNGCELAFHPKSKNFEAVEMVINQFPDMTEMSKMASMGFKAQLDAANMLIYPLIQWIITSNRSHIVKLPQEQRISFMRTPHQFLMLSSPPAKEVAFREAKQKYGSTFAFHGSSIENWHSIIRQGLLNASGTKLQVNGAAYGKGIYLSPHISTSMGYSRMGYSTRNLKKDKSGVGDASRFLSSSNITCIAICEVILSPQLKKNSSIWVCPDADHVCTRFFFVYEDGQVGDSSINTQEEKYLKEIQSACGYKM